MNINLILNHISLSYYNDKLTKNLIVIILGSLALALSARMKIDIGPVPVTLQTLVLLVFSMSVGWKLSISTFLTYLFQYHVRYRMNYVNNEGNFVQLTGWIIFHANALKRLKKVTSADKDQ